LGSSAGEFLPSHGKEIERILVPVVEHRVILEPMRREKKRRVISGLCGLDLIEHRIEQMPSCKLVIAFQ